MHNIYLEIVAILLLIAANGFFALSEFSIIASRKTKLQRQAKQGNKAAARAEKIHSRPETFLATVQVGITFVGTLAGVFSGMTIVDSLTPIIASIPIQWVANGARTISFIIIVFSISFLSVILGELVPKYIALSRPEKIAGFVSLPMTLFTKSAYLFVKVLSGTARLFIHAVGIRPNPEGQSVTEDEINLMIADGLDKGIFDATEKELIHSVFDFSDTIARQAMTPRTEMIGIDLGETTDKILKIITENGFSRYPVYQETLDNIVGIIYTKDVIRIMQHSNLIIVRDIIRKPLFVPDSMKLNALLATFKQKRVHMAVVLDEFGGTAGMITLEDLLEEIVGQIQDEHDTEQKDFIKKNDEIAFVAGSLRIDELNDLFETRLPEEGPNTLAGLVFEQLGHPAHKGEQVDIHNMRFTVLEIEGTRIKRLRIDKSKIKKK
jgi:putative hemolysin